MSFINKIYQVPNIICKGKINESEEPIEVIKINKKYIVSGSRDGNLRIYNKDTYQLIKNVNCHDDWITDIILEEDKIITCSSNNDIKIWDLETFSCIKTLKGHTAGVMCLDLNDKILASGSRDATIKLWNIETGENIRTLEGHARIVSQIKYFGKNKDKLVSASWDHFIKVWDLNTGECLKSYEKHFDAINCLEIYNNNAITGDQSRIILVTDLDTGDTKYTLNRHKRMVMDLLVEKDFLFSVSQDGTLLQWNLNNGICMKKLEGHTEAVLSVSKYQNLITTASTDGLIRIWDDSSIYSDKILYGHDDIVLGLACNGDKIVSVGTENVIKVWDFNTGKFIKDIETGTLGWIWGVAMEENKVIISGDDGIYRIFNIDTGQLIGKLERHNGTTYRLNVRNGIVATTSFDNYIKIWDLEQQSCLFSCKGHTFSPYTAVIVDDDTIVSSGSDSSLRVWDAKTGKVKRVLKGHTNEVFHIANYGRLIATACADKTIKVYNIDTGECIITLEGHQDQVWSIAMKENIIFSGCLDSTLKVWDLEKGICLDTFYGHKGAVKDLCICGDYLISGSKDATIQLWDIKRYFDPEEKQKRDSISQESETLAALLQIGRTYNRIPSELGDPDVVRLIYGLEPLDSSEKKSYQSTIQIIHDKIDSWRDIGHVGLGVWVDDIVRLVGGGIIKLGEDESLDTILYDFMVGLKESPNMYWFGLLRFLEGKAKSVIPKKWSFSLEFSGDGPNPIEGFNWIKLTHSLNNVALGDREETALVFRLNLKNVIEWMIPLIKSIEVQIKDDRGDIEYMIFNNFKPNENGVWQALAMFKIDSGYAEEPNVILDITDIKIVYDENLTPDFRSIEILNEIENLKILQNKMRKHLGVIQDEIYKLDSPKSDEEEESDSISEGYQIQKTDKGQHLKSLSNSPESMNVFEIFQKRFKLPQFGTIIADIGEIFSKFLEYIEPKFILFNSATTITNAILTLLLYTMVFNPDLNLLGTPINIFGNTVTSSEIVIYVAVYGILIIFLLVNIISWIKYQRLKKKLRFMKK